MTVKAHKENEAPSVPHKGRGVTVAPSPFNGIKLELVLLLIIGGLLLLLQGRLSQELTVQLLILIGYGLFSAAWITWRVRRLSQRLRQGGEERGAQ